MTDLPPSIIEIRILVDKPDNYGSYMYRFIDTKHYLKAFYLGIKKDKLPEDGGKNYWSSSENEEFIKLLQGDEPRFILEIIDFKKREDYDYLREKEYTMLREYSNIKTNPATYNLSYGIPPVSKDDIVEERFLKWYHETKDSGIWTSDKGEDVLTLSNLETVQIRYEDSMEHKLTIKAEIDAVAGNTSAMNPVLIFEGVGEVFGFEKGSDIVVGGRHGLMAAKSAKSLELKTIRVPFEVLKGKSEYFLRSLAAYDNYDKLPIVYSATKEDGAKLLVALYNSSGIEPNSAIAGNQIDIIYGLKTRAKRAAIERAITDIQMQKLGNTKWKYWTRKELKNLVREHTTADQLAIAIASGMWDKRKIFDLLKEDDLNGKKRKKIKVIIHHGESLHQINWALGSSEHMKDLNWQFALGRQCDCRKCIFCIAGKEKEYTATFKELDCEIPDTTAYSEEE